MANFYGYTENVSPTPSTQTLACTDQFLPPTPLSSSFQNPRIQGPLYHMLPRFPAHSHKYLSFYVGGILSRLELGPRTHYTRGGECDDWQ